MNKSIKIIICLLGFLIISVMPALGQRVKYEVRITLNDGEKLQGTAEWKDSSIILINRELHILEIKYSEIANLKFYINRKYQSSVGAAIGSPVVGIGSIWAIYEYGKIGDGWTAEPAAGLCGGCVLGGLSGWAIGTKMACKGSFEINGNYTKFQSTRIQWQTLTGS